MLEMLRPENPYDPYSSYKLDIQYEDNVCGDIRILPCF